MNNNKNETACRWKKGDDIIMSVKYSGKEGRKSSEERIVCNLFYSEKMWLLNVAD